MRSFRIKSCVRFDIVFGCVLLGYVAIASCTAQLAPQDVEKIGLIREVQELRKELGRQEQLLNDASRYLEKMKGELTAARAASDKSVSELKAYFENQNLSIMWKAVGVGITPDQGSVTEVDFGRPVVEATAVLIRSHLRFPNNDDHNIRQINSAVGVEWVKGNKVGVRYHAFFDDNSRHRSTQYGLSFLVIARVK
jgi:hypothetical protein